MCFLLEILTDGLRWYSIVHYVWDHHAAYMSVCFVCRFKEFVCTTYLKYSVLFLTFSSKNDIVLWRRVCTFVCVLSVLSVPDRFLPPDFKIVIPLRISCVMAQSLLFITALLSEPLAVLQPMQAVSPPPSISFSLSPACSFSLPAPAGLRDREPALPWQLVLSLSPNRSFLDRCSAARQTLQRTSYGDKHQLCLRFKWVWIPFSGSRLVARRFVCHAHMDSYWQQ